MKKIDWRIVKSVTYKGKWDIERRIFERKADDAGKVSWELIQNWHRHSVANTKRAAVTRAMLLKDLDETLTWEGGPVRLNPLVSIYPA
jgi:hypothetical protein